MPPGIGYGPRSFRDVFNRQQQPKQPTPREQISSRFNRQANIDESQGRESEDIAAKRLRGFDAEEGASRSAQAQFQTFSKDLGRNIQDLRGSQVGRGRLSSGFGFEDEDRLYEGALKDLGNTLAQNALQAQGLNLQAAGQLGQMGGQQTGRFLDVLGSERDASFLEEEQKRRRSAEKRSGLFGALGTLAKGAGGFIAGGPVGAAAALAT